MYSSIQKRYNNDTAMIDTVLGSKDVFTSKIISWIMNTAGFGQCEAVLSRVSGMWVHWTASCLPTSVDVRQG